MGDETDQGLELLPEMWRSAPRRWGHPLHSICSYFAMFPPQVASVFIRWLTSPGDAVYDPFSGRGTTPLEALLHGREGYGSDANPLAHALTRAKLQIPSRAAVGKRLAELESRFDAHSTGVSEVPDSISMLYARGTLKQLVFLRDALGTNRRVDPFIRAMVLGMLHANHSKGGATRGFSVSMPNTFAMAPGYVRKYIEKHSLVAPELDVFSMLRRRAERYALPDAGVRRGRSWRQDATRPAPQWLRDRQPRLIFSSPPYLEVIKYGKYNWVRLWFLKEDSAEIDQRLMASSSLDSYVEFMSQVLAQQKAVVAADGFVCLVIGDVRREGTQLNLAEEVWERSARPHGWHRHALVADTLPEGRKVSRIWKSQPGRATKTDRLLLMSRSADTPLPPLIDIDWNERPSIAA